MGLRRIRGLGARVLFVLVASALLPVGVLHQIEGRFHRKNVPSNGKFQRRHGLIEEPVPGGTAGYRFLMEELFDFTAIRAMLAGGKRVYFDALNALGQGLLPAFSVALGMEPGFLAPSFANENNAILL